jgi:hypothetical protein
MKDVVAAKIEHDGGAFLTTTNDYDERIRYQTCLNSR